MALASPDARTLPRLHLTTDDAILANPRFVEQADRVATEGGVRIAIHLRGHGTSGGALWRIASSLATIASRTGCFLVINDRIDVALGCDAAGVQLGSDSFSPADARRLLGDRRWIGASIHQVEDGGRAAREGADFLLAGTLYESASHPGRAPTGVAWLGELGELRLPVIGIGGITPARVPEVRAAGAYGVAVIGGVWRAASPVDAVGDYLGQLE